MRQFHNVYSWFRTVTSGLLVGGFGSLEHEIEQSSGTHRGFALVIGVLLVLILLKLLEKAAEALVENLTGLRRLLAGRYFVEGYWKMAVRNDSRNNSLTALLLIFHQDNNLVISGSCFTSDGEARGNFLSSLIEYEGGKLHCVVESDAEEGSSLSGVISITFALEEKGPTRFSGRLLEGGVRSELVGKRVIDNDNLKFCRNPDKQAWEVQTFLFGEHH